MTSFMLFAMSTSIELLAMDTKERLDDDSSLNGLQALNKSIKAYPFTIALFIYCFGFSIFVLGLFGFHTFLIFHSTTTNEHIKKHWKILSKNPYLYKSIFKRWMLAICNFPTKSHIKLKQIVY